MAFDLKQWVDGLKLSPDQRAVMETAFTVPENLKYVGDGVLMKSDYSRSMNESKEGRERLEAEYAEKEEAQQALHDELTTWRVDNEKVVQDAVAERDQLKQRLQELATGKPAEPAKPGEPAKPADAPQYVTKAEYEKAVSDVMQFPLVTAELMDLNAEHQELFGKSLRDTKKLVAEALKAKRSLRDQWTEQYKVEERRIELTKKAHDDEIAQVRTEERTRVLSEVNLPAARPSDRPLLVTGKLGTPGYDPAAANKQKERPDPMRGVKAAVEAYNTGKYQPKQ